MVIYRLPDGMVRILPTATLRRERATLRAGRIWWAILALLSALTLCSACGSPPRLPPPNASGTLAALDRIERGIVSHEIAVRDWRMAR
jgi:hypothetical protein